MRKTTRSDARWFLKLLSAGEPGPSPSVRMLLINRRAKALRFLRILGVVNAEGAPLVEELRGRLKNGERFIQLGATYTQDLALMFCGVFLGTGCTKLILFFGPPEAAGELRQLFVQSGQYWQTKAAEFLPDYPADT